MLPADGYSGMPGTACGSQTTHADCIYGTIFKRAAASKAGLPCSRLASLTWHGASAMAPSLAAASNESLTRKVV
jgi:hypothetical protein